LSGITAVIFLLIAAPFIVVISRERGRPTIGDSGRLTYSASINGVDPWYPGDGGQLLGIGTGYVEDIDGPSLVRDALRHPPAKIFDSPPTYSFGDSISGTYPFWYDPSYWQDGVKGHFDIHGQIRAISQSSLMYFYLLKTIHLNIVTPLLVLLLISKAPSRLIAAAVDRWYLIGPCLAGLSVYALVHTEFRYIAAFVPILWLAAATSLTFHRSDELKKFIVVTFSAVALTTAFFAAKTIAFDLFASKPGPVYSRAALLLRNLGLKPGDRIGAISNVAFGDGGAFVARLARLRVTAQVNRPDHYWSEDTASQVQVLSAFHGVGCVGVLGLRIPNSAKGWQRLGNTDYYFYSLSESGNRVLENH
jgi:hypothetical protein